MSMAEDAVGEAIAGGCEVDYDVGRMACRVGAGGKQTHFNEITDEERWEWPDGSAILIDYHGWEFEVRDA